MQLKQLLYRLYEARINHVLGRAKAPRHVGIILDGNRRWAREVGAPAADGHRAGADKVADVLGWAQKAGVEVVTLWLLSTDNLRRDSGELADLLEIICRLVEQLQAVNQWDLQLVGDLEAISKAGERPAAVVDRLRAVLEKSQNKTGRWAHILPVHARMVVNVAIGYGGRDEIVNAVRASLTAAAEQGKNLADVAKEFSAADISAHLYTAGQPEPDLVIRTSGEQRLSGFMIWQSVHTEYFFCDTYWPAFRRTDFLRALRDYAKRERRLGK